MHAKEKTARLGSPKARLFLRVVKEFGFDRGQLHHIEEGLARLIALADLPTYSSDAQCVLGIIYEEGVIGTKDPAKGVVISVPLF